MLILLAWLSSLAVEFKIVSPINFDSGLLNLSNKVVAIELVVLSGSAPKVFFSSFTSSKKDWVSSPKIFPNLLINCPSKVGSELSAANKSRYPSIPSTGWPDDIWFKTSTNPWGGTFLEILKILCLSSWPYVLNLERSTPISSSISWLIFLS